MESKSSTWAIVLAGGEGTRLRALTTDGAGNAVPKQFCAFDGEASMVRVAVARARRAAPAEQVLVIVTEHHRPYWSRDLGDFPPENIVVQPQNRGTGPGILLPLLRVLARDPAATVLVLPSDHHVEREDVFVDAASRALVEVGRTGTDVALLGVEADYAEAEYGWIVPAAEWRGPFRGIREFVEKPDPARCERLYRRGALWNCFVIAATVSSLMALYARRAACLLERFVSTAQDPRADGPVMLEPLYAGLPPCDFSRDLLAGETDHLAVMRVPSCGWTDLGTPDRLVRCLGRGRRRPATLEEPVLDPRSIRPAVEIARSA